MSCNTGLLWSCIRFSVLEMFHIRKPQGLTNRILNDKMTTAPLCGKLNQRHQAINPLRIDQVSRLLSEISWSALVSTCSHIEQPTMYRCIPFRGLSTVHQDLVMLASQSTEEPASRGMYPACSTANDFLTLSSDGPWSSLPPALTVSQTTIPVAVNDITASLGFISNDYQRILEPRSSRSKAAHHPVSDSLDPQGIWLAGQAAAAAQRRDLAYIRRLRRRHENSDRQRARAAGPPAGGAAARGKLGGASAAPY